VHPFTKAALRIASPLPADIVGLFGRIDGVDGVDGMDGVDK
jgi:hypothetical protein